ncbi:MAG: helix-turn-helix transcriptional regulator, partial [Parcubacteria group bacterium]|nr:helix-turn-helix transcriptional regulator [Parcubacteria group bacterium]
MNKKQSNNKIKNNTTLKFKTFDQVFKKSFQSKEFQHAYNEEMARFELANQIRDIRMKQQLTQKTLAEKAKMPQSVIARIESGKNGISLDTLN